MKRRFSVLVLALVAALGTMVPAHATDPPSVSVTKDKAYYVSGQTEKITVVVAGAGSGKTLRITVGLPDGTSKVPNQSTAYDDTFHFSYAVYVNHTITADLLDGSTLVATRTISVSEVAGITTTATSGYLGYSGSYAVYSRGVSPKFRSTDESGRVAKRCLRHVVQRRYAAGWKTVFTSACRAEAPARVDWKWLGKHASAVKFRVRGTFAGDNWNKPGHAAWLYFKFR